MSVCSYSTLSRYEEDSSCRSKNIDDIRAKLRESVERSRHISKVRQMFDNRPSLSRFYDEDEYYDDDETDNWPGGPTDELGWPLSSGSGQPDNNGTSGFDSQLQVQTLDWSTDDNESHCQHSPCWSAASSSPPSIIQLGDHNVPYYFLESPATSPRSNKSAERSNKSSSNIRQRRYKQNSLTLAVNRNRYYYDPSLARTELDTIKNIILQCNLDAANISHVVSTRCPLLLNAMLTLDDELCRESMGILTTLTQESLILPEAILTLFQTGLTNCLRDCIYRLDDGIFLSLRLLLNIANSAPSTIPYIIELLRNSTMFNELDNSLVEMDLKKSIYFVKFLHQIIQKLLTETQPEPSVPEVLLATGISSETLESYSPLATCLKLISPKTIENTVNACLDRYYMDNEEVITSALVMLASTIRLVHFKSIQSSSNPDTSTTNKDTEWIIKILKGFKNSNLESNLNKLIKALDRLVQQSEFSEHCSQGVGVGSSAATIKDQCQQFSTFYQQYYGSLEATYGHMI